MSDEQLIAEMLAGLEGVTQGPWKADGYYVFGDWPGSGPLFKALRSVPFANAAHIARCSPDNIRRLLTRARSAHADIEAGDGPVSAHLVIATKAMWKARSLIDEAMGDTDPNDENDPLLKACQALSKALNKIGAKP